MPQNDWEEDAGMTTPSVLILFAHPAFQWSRVNTALVRAAQSVEGITFHDLYEAYPDLVIDEQREQGLMESHEVVIWQHPLYWYSTPPILKEWQDIVLTHGWAYGSGGDALREKTLLNAVTTGGRESSYRAEGSNEHSLLEFLLPIRQTAALCGMRFLPPFAVHGTHRLDEMQIEQHSNDYRRLLAALRDGRFDFERALTESRLNRDLDALVLTEAGGSR